MAYFGASHCVKFISWMVIGHWPRNGHISVCVCVYIYIYIYIYIYRINLNR